MAWDDAVVAMAASEERTGWSMAAILPWRREGRVTLPVPVHGLARGLFQVTGTGCSQRQQRPSSIDGTTRDLTGCMREEKGAPFAVLPASGEGTSGRSRAACWLWTIGRAAARPATAPNRTSRRGCGSPACDTIAASPPGYTDTLSCCPPERWGPGRGSLRNYRVEAPCRSSTEHRRSTESA